MDWAEGSTQLSLPRVPRRLRPLGRVVLPVLRGDRVRTSSQGHWGTPLATFPPHGPLISRAARRRPGQVGTPLPEQGPALPPSQRPGALSTRSMRCAILRECTRAVMGRATSRAALRVLVSPDRLRAPAGPEWLEGRQADHRRRLMAPFTELSARAPGRAAPDTISAHRRGTVVGVHAEPRRQPGTGSSQRAGRCVDTPVRTLPRAGPAGLDGRSGRAAAPPSLTGRPMTSASHNRA